MPTFYYRGRDKNGTLRSGDRFAPTIDGLGEDLLKEGITPIEIKLSTHSVPIFQSLKSMFENKTAQLEDLSIFAKQMQLLHQAGVPIITSMRQIASFTRLKGLSNALNGCIEHIEKGEKLSSAMSHYPHVFPKLIVSIVQIGENTGKLSESFGHLHDYLSFESKNIKQLKAAFRYPMFVSIAIVISIITMNVFVIPMFANFYTNMKVSLPWQTNLLIMSSNLITHYGIYILIALFVGTVLFYRFIHTPSGAYKWGKFLLHVPVLGKLLRRLTLIRLSQSLAIILNAGLGITQALSLARDLMTNEYIRAEIEQSQKLIERGTVFTQALAKVDLFSPLELQILAVGEKNGELGAAMSYIGTFHANEVEFDLKRLNDWIGPILIAISSILILIVAMGIYLPIWNMINLVHS